MHCDAICGEQTLGTSSKLGVQLTLQPARIRCVRGGQGAAFGLLWVQDAHSFFDSLFSAFIICFG